MKGAKVGYHADLSTLDCYPDTDFCSLQPGASSSASQPERHSGTVGVGLTFQNGTFNLPKCRFVFTGHWMCIKTKDLL